MAVSERSGADYLRELDEKFFNTLALFTTLAVEQSARLTIEHTAHESQAIHADGVRYPVRPE